ncbi:MAG: heavy metal response regulator transcription factor [Planctomycetota bacterium]
MKLLVVEDELKAATYLQKGLGENGYVVDVANDGQAGLTQALSTGYDLVILDVMLPTMDGWTVLEKMREVKVNTPVLVLTARDAVHDRVKGLELGADDYLVKPFAFSELLARVRSLLRRGKTLSETILRIGDLEIDFVRHKAHRSGKRMELTPKEFALLSLMARRAGEVLSRTLIAEQVWDMNFDCGTNIVDVHMRRLRSKADDPFDNKLIHTVRGVGYVLEDRKTA